MDVSVYLSPVVLCTDGLDLCAGIEEEGELIDLREDLFDIGYPRGCHYSASAIYLTYHYKICDFLMWLHSLWFFWAVL